MALKILWWSGCRRCSANVILEPDMKITQPWLHLDAPTQINHMLFMHSNACWYWELSIQMNSSHQTVSVCLVYSTPIFVTMSVRYLTEVWAQYLQVPPPMCVPPLLHPPLDTLQTYIFLHQEKKDPGHLSS